jgi:hypothetical protein
VRTSNLVYYFSLRMKEKLANYRDAAWMDSDGHKH